MGKGRLEGWLTWLAIAGAVGTATAPSAAIAADDAKSWAKAGADAFNKNQFYEAAVAFEKAAQLDPGNPKNLRYAGRAWQQLGHWKRALVLLEMYLKIEPNPEHRASIGEFLEPLRKATPRDIAAALNSALIAYPQARLESEAAKAYEEVGDEPALKRAAELWEVSRVRAASDLDKQAAEAGLQRVTQRQLDLKAKRDREDEERKRKEAEARARDAEAKAKETENRAKEQKAKEAAIQDKAPAAPAGAAPGQPIALYTAGGVLVAGGVVLGVMGYTGASSLNANAAKDFKGNYGGYRDAKSTQDTIAYSGWSIAAVGVGVTAWAFLSHSSEPKRAVLVPTLSADGLGMAWAAQF